MQNLCSYSSPELNITDGSKGVGRNDGLTLKGPDAFPAKLDERFFDLIQYAELARLFFTQAPQTATSGERFRHVTGSRLSH
jgi:hypothetical protein